MSPQFETLNWGQISYQEALQKQMELVEARIADKIPDTLIFCSHPPVVTLGRGTKPTDLIGWRGETVEISRGGRATYHGPNQVVVYPILKLDVPRAGCAARDLHAYMDALERAVVATLGKFGVNAHGSNDMSATETLQPAGSEAPSFTGVWVGERKIASIGIGVRKWVSYHGLAFNLVNDHQAFQGLNPCGFKASTMISLEEILGQEVSRENFTSDLRLQLLEQLSPTA